LDNVFDGTHIIGTATLLITFSKSMSFVKDIANACYDACNFYSRHFFGLIPSTVLTLSSYLTKQNTMRMHQGSGGGIVPWILDFGTRCRPLS
jgi:hypothetical protein